MARKPWSRVAVAVGLVALFAGCIGAPVWFAVEGTVLLATTEPVRVEDVECVTGSRGGHCTGSWTLADGTEHRERLSGDLFVDDGDEFSGYGNGFTAAPTRWFWILSQLLYAIPIGLVFFVVVHHRSRVARAGGVIAAEDEAAMNARVEEIRRGERTPEPGD
ncbi:hypothetical protein [Stackebrandtia albiflava]|nr:hypothetical protein [Stackebrandtia albiflava]